MTAVEADLLSRWAGGDRVAGEALLAMVFPVLTRFFETKLSVADTEDLVQRTMLALVEKRERWQAGPSFRAFLLGVARIELLRFLRTRHRGQAREDELAQQPVSTVYPSPSAVAVRREDERRLLAALRQIPLELQIALELQHWQGLTMEEIGAVLEIPAGTVKSRIRRAREQLERVLVDTDAPASLVDASVSRLEAWARRLHEAPESAPATNP